MRIGIDARFYGPFGKGLGRYTEKLILHLEKIDKENKYFIFLRKDNWVSYKPANKNFKKVLADYKWYSMAEQIFLPWKVLAYRLDIMHFTHFNVPLLYFGKFVVTIHDLILAKYPTQRATTLGPIFYKIKQTAYRLVIRLAVTRAAKVIAVSKYTKKEIAEHFNIELDKIAVTYESVDLPEIQRSDQLSILAEYGLKKPYLLYVGNVYPHKNIEGLLKAFKNIIQDRPQYRLALVGREDYFFDRLKKVVDSVGLNQSVIFTGFVTDQDLPVVYANACLYVFPSFCEGFGLPALEACSFGIPVAASNNSCLPEILGEAAEYFNPHDITNMADKIRYVLDNPEIAFKLSQNGLKRAKKFSWQTMATITLNIYRELLYNESSSINPQ